MWSNVKRKLFKVTQTHFHVLIKYTNYFGFPFNTQTNFCLPLDTQTFENDRLKKTMFNMI